MKKSALFCPSLLLACLPLEAAVVISFPGGSGPTDFQAGSVAPGLTVSPLSAGSDLTGFVANASGSAGTGYRAFNWTTSNTASIDSALYFTVTVQPGYNAQFDGVSFFFRPQGSGPQTVSVEVDRPAESRALYPGSGPLQYLGYLDSIEVYETWGFFGATGTVSLSAGQSVTLYVQGYDARNSNKELSIDDINIQGSVTSIPEPTSLGLLAGAAGLGLVAYRRRRV